MRSGYAVPNLATRATDRQTDRQTELKKAARRGRIIQHTGPTALVRAANRQRQRRRVKDFSPAPWSVSGQLVLAFSTAARFIPRLDGSSSLCLAVCKKTNPRRLPRNSFGLTKKTTGSPGRSPSRSKKAEPCGGHLSNP